MPMRILALPGTLCSPVIFEPAAGELRDEIELWPLSWLTDQGPWDIPAVAGRIAARLDGAGGAGGAAMPVLGHSTGGAIALQLAISRPDLVSGLLLSDTGAHTHGHGDVDAILTAVAEDWGPALHAAVLDRSFLVPPEPVFRQQLLDWAGTVEQQAAYEALASQRNLDVSAQLADIAVPVVVVHGRYDRARSVAQAQELAGSIPGAELVLLETGHTPVYEAPAQFAAAVRRLLARLPDC